MANYGYQELSTAFPAQAVHLCVPLPRPDRQIRVLDLDPVYSESPAFAQVLQGRLHVLNELTDFEYTALSYVWAQEDRGTSERENRLIIHCKDHQHEARIGPNCWSALWHLCKTRRPWRTLIWVDSICIDQKNDEEKKQQISLMRGIYESAQTSYFWLGEAAEGTDEAMDFLSRDRITMSVGGVGNILLLVNKIFWYMIKYHTYPHRSGLQNIFGRGWVNRLWTLQECILSQKGVLMCGEKSVPWEDLVCALETIHYFHTHPWSLHFDDLYLPWLNLANLTRWFADNSGDSSTRVTETFNLPYPRVQPHLHCLKWAVRIDFMFSALAFGIAGIESPLLALLGGLLLVTLPYIFPAFSTQVKLFFPRTQHSVLEEIRNRKVTNPKDMYNGMAGILRDEASDPDESLHVIYRRLCTSLICKTRSLEVLLFANTCADNNYCSWSINWNSKTTQLWGKAIYYMDKRRSMGVPDVWPIESSTQSQQTWTSFVPTKEVLIRQTWFLKQDYLRKYSGAMPATQPQWNFRDHGETLCVYGLVLTHISSHLAPSCAEAKVTPLHPLRRVLLSIKTRANLISAQAFRLLQKPSIWFSQKTTNSPMEMTRPQEALPTTGATHLQVECSMLISVLHDAFAGMSTADQLRAQKQLTALMIVATGKRRLDHDLRIWWHTLRGAAGTQGKEWLEDKVSTDEYMWNSLISVMHILQKAELSAVRCEASRSLANPGGLAFAAAGARTGDVVALVSGVSFPLVLRPCGHGRFRLVGPIFFPGVMDGELKDQVTRVTLDEIILV